MPMLPWATIIPLAALVASTTPLTDAQRSALVGAVDGGGHQEPAMAALLENARTWTVDAAVDGDHLTAGEERADARPADMATIDDHAAHRGRLFRLDGVVQQQTVLLPRADHMLEWFIRAESGVPLIVYMDDRSLLRPVRDGERIVMSARYYKRMDFTSRDGRSRSYAAFVGAHPRVVGVSTPSPIGGAAIPFGIVVALGLAAVLFFALLLWARRRFARPAPVLARMEASKAHWPGVAGVDGGTSLPDDPAAALAELRRRAEDDP
jgi:hypothetical protein